MTMEIGDSLNPYQGLEFFVGSSPEELKDQLTAIRVPFKLLAIYAQGTRHVAWVQTGAQKIKKVTKQTKE